jgi:hypothetical protein
MRWPWQRREPDPIEAEIEDQTAKHLKVLQRARRALAGATEDIALAERMIVDDYARADQERRK